MLTVLCVALRLILALIGVRLLPFLLAIVVAVWLLHHIGWMIAIIVAAVLLTIIRAIGTHHQ